MSYKRLDLHKIELDIITKEVYQNYADRTGMEKKRGIYRYKNFPRFSYVLDLLESGNSILDVGVFTGQFLDILTLSEKYKKVIGIDIVKKPGFFTISNNYEFKIIDCRAMPFKNQSFDSVVCMEVLEHLPVIDFPKALSELRRVCKHQLVMSVPYNEQPPLSKNHFQSFDESKIELFFPDAEKIILTANGKDIWILILEEKY